MLGIMGASSERNPGDFDDILSPKKVLQQWARDATLTPDKSRHGSGPGNASLRALDWSRGRGPGLAAPVQGTSAAFEPRLAITNNGLEKGRGTRNLSSACEMGEEMKFEEIVSAARAKTGGLPDPDVDSWQEGLQMLLYDHVKQDLLSERGRQIMTGRYVNALATRMRVDEFMRQNPAVAQTPVERPVFILGLVRTGTTLASNLMASDPANRSLLRWEAYNIVPPAAPGALTSDPRCVAEKAQDEVMIKSNPKGVAQHFEPADGPTECVNLLAQDFRSMMFTAMTSVPTYADWVLFCDQSSSYAHRKRVLQILQTTNPGRWVLKMPSDSVFIPWIFKTFPDARVIWTHRDPFAATASSFSMRGNSRLIFQKDVDLPYMRSRFPIQLGLHTRRPLELARERPDVIYNLYYDELLSNPLAAMRKVYAWLGWDWTEAAAQGMQSWLAGNPQGRFGKHSYSLAEWGFTRKDLEPYFADYLRVHPVADSVEA
jgi:Sulfotransferase family